MTTQAEAKKIIQALGLTFKKTEFGDYRVAFQSNPAGACFTDDIEDAIGTARAMAAEADRNARLVAEELF